MPKKATSSSLFSTRLTKSKFCSPVTFNVYPRTVQEQLRDVLATRKDVGGSSKGQSKDTYQYWLTFSQALRSFNTMPRFGQEPARVTGGATKVVPISSLREAEQSFLLQAHPPQFFSGVGVFVDNKWNKLLHAPLIKFLNPKKESRALFIDVDTCEDNGFSLAEGKSNTVVSVAGVADRILFCADQMDHVERIFPIRGLALNPTTARRYTQPAHDVLVTAALLRGYVSPFWLTENQITRFYGVSLRSNFAQDFVEVPGRVSVLIKLSSLAKEQQQRVLTAYPPPADEERRGLTVALDGGNWEVVVHQVVLQKMCDMGGDDMWVSLSTMRYLFDNWFKGAKQFHFLNCSSSDASKELAHFLDSSVGRGSWLDQCQITKMKLFNAEATTNPRKILPQTRNVALCGGRPIHTRYLSTVMRHSFEQNYLSPIWLTPFDVLKIPGLAVKPNEKPLELSEKAQLRELLFNVDDLEPESAKKCLAKYPMPKGDDAKHKHFSLHLSWLSVLSAARHKFLSSLGRERNLWIPHKEVVFNGFKVKAGVQPIQVMTGQSGSQSTERAKARGADSARKLFNAEQTTDPVRVSALALMKIL